MPLGIRNYLISLPYNDIEAVERAFQAHGEELAAVVLEPIMGNVACILPIAPGCNACASCAPPMASS